MIVNCLHSMGGTYFIKSNPAAKDLWQFVLRERSGFLQLLSQGRIILGLSESLEFFIDNKRWNC